MIDLARVIDTIFGKARRAPYSLDMVTLTNANETTTGHKVRVSGAPSIEVTDATGSQVIRTLDRDERGKLYATAGMVSRTAFARTVYRNALDDPAFLQLYGAQDRQVHYVIGSTPTVKIESTLACMRCGLVLPRNYLTIDHQRPQTNGELEAVAKTFRAFGLTKEGPKGPKAAAIDTHINSGAPLQPVPTAAGRAATAGQSLDDRYSLNDLGAILYSFVKNVGELDNLRSSCMHGLLNLRPVCHICNPSVGNSLKYVPVRGQ